jgi:hypothetical protein
MAPCIRKALGIDEVKVSAEKSPRKKRKSEEEGRVL